MSQPEPSVTQLAAKADDLAVGFKWLLGLLLVVVLLPNAFVALILLPKLAQFCADALPGKPQPLLTLFVEHSWGFLFMIALAWPVAGIVILARSKCIRFWAVTSVIITFVSGMQLMMTLVGLLMPMVELFTGLQNQGGS